MGRDSSDGISDGVLGGRGLVVYKNVGNDAPPPSHLMALEGIG